MWSGNEKEEIKKQNIFNTVAYCTLQMWKTE